MGNTRYRLTKADLADAIYVALLVDKQKALQIVEDYIELIKDALEKEGRAMLSGFGSYEVKYKPPRRGRNPQTGDSIILRARKVVKFKPSQLLRKAMNGQRVGRKTRLRRMGTIPLANPVPTSRPVATIEHPATRSELCLESFALGKLFLKARILLEVLGHGKSEAPSRVFGQVRLDPPREH